MLLLIIGLYIIYILFNIKETFGMSPATLTQLRSTSIENTNQHFLCKNCGSNDIVLVEDSKYKRRRNYG